MSNGDSDEEGVLTFAEIVDNFCLEKERPAITALKASQPVRNVPLNRDHTTGDYRNVNFERAANYEALLIQATGDLQEQPCQRCATGHGPFVGCVTSPIAGNGACGNCHYNAQGSKCGYHHRSTNTAKRDGKHAAPPEDQPTGPVTHKHARTGNEAVLATQAHIDFVGGPGPATMAYRMANAFRAASPTAPGISGSSSGSHGGLNGLEPSNPDNSDNANRVSHHDSHLGPLRAQMDQPQAPHDAIKIEDSDDDMEEAAGPRLGTQMLNVQAPVAGVHMAPAGVLAPLANMNLSAPAGFQVPALGLTPAVAPLAIVNNLPGAPTASDYPFPFVTGSSAISYNEAKRFARELRALADEYDDRAEQMLGRRELANAAPEVLPPVRGTPASLSYDENRLMARQFRAREPYISRAELTPGASACPQHGRHNPPPGHGHQGFRAY